MAHQHYSLCRENFCGLPMTTYFSVLITKQKNFSGNNVCNKNPRKPQKFFPQMFYHTQYSYALVKALLQSAICSYD